MIEVTSIATQAHKGDGSKRYRFRTEESINQAVNEAVTSRRGKKPVYNGNRGIPVLYPSADEIAESMLHQQRLHNKTAGLRVREEMLSISENELHEYNGRKQIRDIADRMSDFFYERGHQVAYGVYPFNDERGKGYDVLYAINTVSFRDGSKYIRNSNEYQEMVTRAARTVLGEVTGTQIKDEDYFDFRSLEYHME